MLTSLGRYWLCFFDRTKEPLLSIKDHCNSIQIPKASEGGGERGVALSVPSPTNSINNIIEIICIITEIFSREIFFSIYISAATDVNADLNKT